MGTLTKGDKHSIHSVHDDQGMDTCSQQLQQQQATPTCTDSRFTGLVQRVETFVFEGAMLWEEFEGEASKAHWRGLARHAATPAPKPQERG